MRRKMSNVKFIGNCKLEIKNWKFQSAFTLIELIVVITIIAILVAAISISWAKAQEKSRDARRKSDLKAIQQALDTYFETTNSFPAATVDGKIKCREADTSKTSFVYVDSTIEWGSNFTCTKTAGGTDTFFQTFPKDPVYQNNSGYYYSAPVTGKSYVLSAQLENTNDPDIPASSDCQSGYNYCVKNQ